MAIDWAKRFGAHRAMLTDPMFMSQCVKHTVGDIVIHIIDGQIIGFSTVQAKCREQETEPPNAGQWAGMAPYHVVQLGGYRQLTKAVILKQFLADHAKSIRQDIEPIRPLRYPFQESGKGPLQASLRGYLYRCTAHLYEIFQGAISSAQVDGVVSSEPTADEDEFNDLVRRLLNDPPADPPDGNATPETVDQTRKAYKRDPAVKAWVLKEADGICELCGQAAPFDGVDGYPFLEVHHVITIADGGPDMTNNAVALCPNCHRRCHYSADRDDAVTVLYSHIKRLDEQVSK